MAWIEKRGDHYLVRWREPSDGHQVSQGVPTWKIARALKGEVETQMARGAYVPEAYRNVTLVDYAEALIADSLELRPKTLRGYHWWIERHLRTDPLGSVPIGELTQIHCRAYLHRCGESGLAPNSILGIRARLAKVLNQAEAEGRLPRGNPLKGVRGPRQPKTTARPLERVMVEAIAEAIEPRYRLAVFLGAYCGLRESEVAAVRTQDLDLAARTLNVSHQTGLDRGLVEPKTPGSARKVPIPGFVVEEIETHLPLFGPLEDGRLFSTGSGLPARGQDLYRAFKTAAKRVGIPGATFHELRHTGASLLIQAGRHPKEIQEWCRHASMKTTLDVYGHLFPGRLAELADDLDGMRREALAVTRLQTKEAALGR